jgi:hypothetical protein
MYTDAFTAPVWTAALGVVIVMAMISSSIAALYFIYKDISEGKEEKSGAVSPMKSEEENMNGSKKGLPEETIYPSDDNDGFQSYEEYPMDPNFSHTNPEQRESLEDLNPPIRVYAHGRYQDQEQGQNQGQYSYNTKEGGQPDVSIGDTFFLDIPDEQPGDTQGEAQGDIKAGISPGDVQGDTRESIQEDTRELKVYAQDEAGAWDHST